MTTADNPHAEALQRALKALDRMQARLEAVQAAAHEPVAIVGLGCRFPGADGPEAFLDRLRVGYATVGPIPGERAAAFAGTDEALAQSIELVADKSRIATLVRGKDAAGLGIRAFSGGSPEPLTDQQKAWRGEAIPIAAALIAHGDFSVELGPQLPLADAAEAHRLVDAGADGKVVLLP